MLDIYDINYEYCSEKLGILNLPSSNLPRKGIVYRLLSQIKGVLKYGLSFNKKGLLQKKSILFFHISQNELNSVKAIVSKLPNASLFGNDNYKNGYPIGKIYWFSLFFIPCVFYQYFRCKNLYYKRAFSYAFDGFCIAYASKYILRSYLKKLQPSQIIIANQLSCYHRSLAYAAKELGIKTVYIQHASITEQFSNLNLFSSALLEGKDSLNKYQRNGTCNTQLYLIGMPKFDQYFSKVKKNVEIHSIGICTNGLDDFEPYEKLLKLLSSKMPYIKVFIRPHPADRRKDDWYELSKKYNSHFSDVLKREAFEFFEEVDLVIAGDSNIHLEATLLNIPSIYFDPFHNKVDWYGFAKNNLVYYSNNVSELYEYISEISALSGNVRQRAKFYVETVDTIFDGKSSELATKIIRGDDVHDLFSITIDSEGNTIYRIN
ncbi:hypothetical protein SAMN04487898_102270 [Pedobacter sp. ok626]|nr:hypothetical protein SAMN04487898_102270 [Pedobacter sp. ok626]